MNSINIKRKIYLEDKLSQLNLQNTKKEETIYFISNELDLKDGGILTEEERKYLIDAYLMPIGIINKYDIDNNKTDELKLLDELSLLLAQDINTIIRRINEIRMINKELKNNPSKISKIYKSPNIPYGQLGYIEEKIDIYEDYLYKNIIEFNEKELIKMIKEKFNKMLDNIEKEELIIQKIMLPSKMVDRKITKEFIHNQTKTKIIEQFSKKETYYFPQELKLKIIKLIKTLSKDKNLYIKTSYPKEDYITITTTKKEIIPNPQFIQIEIYRLVEYCRFK